MDDRARVILVLALIMTALGLFVVFLAEENEDLRALVEQCQCSQSENDSTQGGTE